MDLTTSYMGLDLRNPLVASASPFSNTIAGISQLATTGVDDAADVAKYLLVGADVVMTASALIRHGYGHACVLLDGLSAWMSRMEFSSVSEVRGLLAVPEAANEAAQERAGYVSSLHAADLGYRSW